jgi:hypothetical protein
MHRFFRRNLPTEARLRAWTGERPWVKRMFSQSGFLGLQRRTLARGVGVGLFVGLTPTVGFQTLLMICLCVFLRASFPAAFLVSWISNPFTVGPLYFAFNRLGEALFGDLLRGSLALLGIGSKAAEHTVYLVLGSLLIALPAALGGYWLFLGAWRLSVLRRWRSRGRGSQLPGSRRVKGTRASPCRLTLRH